MQYQRGFVTAQVIIVLLLGFVVAGGAGYVLLREPSIPSTVTENEATPVDTANESLATQPVAQETPAPPKPSTNVSATVTLDCSTFTKTFSNPQQSFQQLAADFDAYFQTPAAIKQVQLFLSAYYGLDSRSFVTGRMDNLTTIQLKRFQGEQQAAVQAGTMNILTQGAMSKSCPILADRIRRGVSTSLVGNEPLSISGELVFNGSGALKNEYAGKGVMIGMRYTNNNMQHVAVVSVPYCGAPTKIFPVVNGSVSATPAYDNAQDIQACEAKESRLIASTILPGESLSQLVGTSPKTTLTAGTYQIEVTPRMSQVNLGVLKGTFVVTQ
jgi:hypothetical protein